MKATIVVATYNRAPALRRTLECLNDLPQRPPIVVVDNASTDETQAVVRSFGDRITGISLPYNAGAAGRTIGARAARTPLVAFCDDDGWWASDALDRAAERFERLPHLGVVNARVLVRGNTVLDPACAAMSNGAPPEREGVPIAYFMAGASIMRRDAYLEAGGYDQRYHIGAEESLLSLDIAARGWTMLYCDDVVLYHYPSPLARATEDRRRLSLRNQLWTTWLRRCRRCAIDVTKEYVRRAVRDRIARRALGEALLSMPWVLQHRRPIPEALERRVEAIAVPVFD